MYPIILKKLKNRIAIARLFKDGTRIRSGAVSGLFLSSDTLSENHFYVGVTVSKKNMSLAVHRNRAKRQLRSGVQNYCCWKESPEKKGVGMFFFHSKAILETSIVEKAVAEILDNYFKN